MAGKRAVLALSGPQGYAATLLSSSVIDLEVALVYTHEHISLRDCQFIACSDKVRRYTFVARMLADDVCCVGVMT